MEAFVTFFVAFMSTGLVLSFAGNLLIFICIWRQMKSTGTISATDVFVLNLALSDMVFGGFVLPQQLHDVSHSGDFYEGMRITLGQWRNQSERATWSNDQPAAESAKR